MNRNKNPLIPYYPRKKPPSPTMRENKNPPALYHPWKKPPKPHSTQKKVFHALSFQPRSKTNSKFSFYDSLCEINGIKLQTMIQASNSMYFPRDSPRPTCFDAIIRQRLKKKIKVTLNLFFKSRMK